MDFEIIDPSEIVRSKSRPKGGSSGKGIKRPRNIRKVEVPQKVNKKGCIECGSNTKLFICSRCLFSSEIRFKYGIGVASDYALGKDYLTNCVAFLHACGQLENFLDKVYSEPEVMFELEARPLNRISVNDLEELIRFEDSIEESMNRNAAAFLVRSPGRPYKTTVKEKKQ